MCLKDCLLLVNSALSPKDSHFLFQINTQEKWELNYFEVKDIIPAEENA